MGYFLGKGADYSEFAMDEPRYIIVHGHFYQPPRQSPWTGLIADEPGAAPFANWNERILSECYSANAHAQIMNGHVVHIHNNYAQINFDLGPTLAGWIENHGKVAYRAIRRGEELSVQARHGHGNAIAQSYNHSILPLLDERSRRLQIEWGIQDFIFRFGHRPEGLWLPECAADDDTLASVAQTGIRFVILACDQGHFSSSGREAGPFLWQREGSKLAIFRFDRELSGYLAFGDALNDGARLADAFAQTALSLPPGAAILIATDGETFGHHKRPGAAELARAFAILQDRDDVVVTNCGDYLETHPAAGSFVMNAATSWSCAHGVERWQSNCGCRLDEHTNQEWRAPLRSAIDFVKRHVDGVFERSAASLTADPWDALLESAPLFADSAAAVQDRFFARHKVRNDDAREQLLRLFEMERAAHTMLTSCAWFFDDFGGPEGRIALRWAARAVELAAEFEGDIEHQLIERLRRIHSNRREIGDAATLYLSVKTREARGRV
jgi:alpha-amylase/alpha-mannosidase (GH57 family)